MSSFEQIGTQFKQSIGQGMDKLSAFYENNPTKIVLPLSLLLLGTTEYLFIKKVYEEKK